MNTSNNKNFNTIEHTDTNFCLSSIQGDTKITSVKSNNFPLTMNGINFSYIPNNIDNHKVAKSSDKVIRQPGGYQTFSNSPYQVIEINDKVNHRLKISKFSYKGRNKRRSREYHYSDNERDFNRNNYIKTVEIDLRNKNNLTTSNINMMINNKDNNTINTNYDVDDLKNKKKIPNKYDETKRIKERWLAKSRIEDEVRVTVLGEIKNNSSETYINNYLNNTLLKNGNDNTDYYFLTQQNENLIHEPLQLNPNNDIKNEMSKFINKNINSDYIPPVLILDSDQIKNLYDETVKKNKNLLLEKQSDNIFEITADKTLKIKEWDKPLTIENQIFLGFANIIQKDTIVYEPEIVSILNIFGEPKKNVFDQELLNEENQINSGGMFELTGIKKEKEDEKEDEDIVLRAKINNSLYDQHENLIVNKEIELNIKAQICKNNINDVEIIKKECADFEQNTPASLLNDKFLFFAVSKNTKYCCPVFENNFSYLSNICNSKNKCFDINLMQSTGFYLCIERRGKHGSDRLNSSSKLKSNKENKELGHCNTVVGSSHNIQLNDFHKNSGKKDN